MKRCTGVGVALTRSVVWRRAQGDEQLDFTYARSEPPHHIPDDCLSELALCMYKARILPQALLQRCVRAVFEPNEYPPTMERMYAWCARPPIQHNTYVCLARPPAI